MTPDCSILIATHNRAKMLGYALESAQAQTHKNIEIVVYDDGSTDETKAVVLRARRADLRVRYHREPRNRGVGFSRARLLALAKAPHACWLDSDDMCNVHRLEIQLAVMRKHEPSFVRTGRTVFGSKRRGGFTAWMDAPTPSHRVNHDVEMVSPSLMFNVEKARAVGYDRRLRCGSDVLFEMKMTLAYGTGLFIPWALYHYGRGHNTRVTKRVERSLPGSLLRTCWDLKKAECEEVARALEAEGIQRWPNDVRPKGLA